MMKRRWELPGAVVGATMVVAALAGVGTTAEAAGTATHFSVIHDFDGFTQSNALVHWARCTKIGGDRKTNVIDYKINPAGHAYRVRLVKRAVRKVHKASGLTFRYRGKTSYIPHNDALGHFQALDQRRKTHSDLVVAWAIKGTGAHASNLLQDFEQGVGSIKWASGPTSQLRILEGAVVMERGQHLRRGFLAGGSEGTLLLHEFGHAVGLNHYEDGTQIMNPFLGKESPSGYATGDRAGLAKVGSDTKCLTTAPLLPSN